MSNKKTPPGAAGRRVVYVGDDKYRPGIPARDLTMAEWERLPKAERQLCLDLELYRIEGGNAAQTGSRAEATVKDDDDE